MIYRYLSYFFIYACFGWVMEVDFSAVTRKKFVNCGLLNGPLCPIYGFGALSVIHFLSPYKDWVLLLFLASVVIASILELIVGFLLEILFHQRLWDYSDRKFNIAGYICPEFSLLWGVICFLLMKWIHPLIVKGVSLVPRGIGTVLLVLFASALIVDVIATINTLTGLNRQLREIDRISRQIREASDQLGIRIADKAMNRSQRLDAIRSEYERLAALPEAEDRVKELGKLFESRRQLMQEKAGTRRLFQAFPKLKSKRHPEFLDEMKKKISSHKK